MKTSSATEAEKLVSFGKKKKKYGKSGMVSYEYGGHKVPGMYKGGGEWIQKAFAKIKKKNTIPKPIIPRVLCLNKSQFLLKASLLTFF